MSSIARVMEIISNRLNGIEKDLRSDIPEDYKKYLEVEQAVFRRLKDLFEWESLSIIEKQESRLSTLASMRKSGAIEEIISAQKSAIFIYELLNSSLPYIKAVNINKKLDLIEELCRKELEIVDSAGSTFRGKHVSKEEIETAFQSYFKEVQPNTMAMFKECYDKIEELYQALKSLPES